MEKVEILLVEDNQDDAVLTLRALMRKNLANKVYVVQNGEEALDFLFCANKYAGRDPQDMPQLTLLDIELPKLNGLEVLRRVRAEERTRQLPIVLFSSSNNEQDMIEGYKNGANSYVCKPVDFDQFVECVQQLSSHWLRSSATYAE